MHPNHVVLYLLSFDCKATSHENNTKITQLMKKTTKLLRARHCRALPQCHSRVEGSPGGTLRHSHDPGRQRTTDLCGRNRASARRAFACDAVLCVADDSVIGGRSPGVTLSHSHDPAGIPLLRLNISRRPIANKYSDGKMKRTLTRELKVPETDERACQMQRTTRPPHLYIGYACIPHAISRQTKSTKKYVNICIQ